MKEPEERINSLQPKDSATAGVEDNERRVSWAVISLRWYPRKRCTTAVLSELGRNPGSRVLRMNDLRWMPICEATIAKQNILACNTDSISQKRCSKCAVPNANVFLHVNKPLIRPRSIKTKFSSLNFKYKVSVARPKLIICVAACSKFFFFAFLHVAVVRVYVSRLVLLSLCSRITI